MQTIVIVSPLLVSFFVESFFFSNMVKKNERKVYSKLKLLAHKLVVSIQTKTIRNET